MTAKIKYGRRERTPDYAEVGVIADDISASVTAWKRDGRIELVIHDRDAQETLARVRFDTQHTIRADDAPDWTGRLIVEHLAPSMVLYDEAKHEPTPGQQEPDR